MIKTIALSTGGTGGHVFPAIALSQQLLQHNYKVIAITDNRAKKFNTFWHNSVQLHTVQSSGLNNKKLSTILKILFLNFIGFWQALFLFLQYQPNVLVSFGGYSSIPTMLCAKLLGIKIIMHEQNSVLGKTNKIFLPLVNTLATSFTNTKNINAKYKNKVVNTGLPLRNNIYNLPINYNNNNNNKINVFIIGGSLGASVFASSIPKAFLKLSPKQQTMFVVHHQCIKAKWQQVNALWQQSFVDYTVSDFFNNSLNLINNSNLVIARSGASTVFEIATLNKFAVLVPFKQSAHNHQYYNAVYAQSNFNCDLVLQDDFNENVLLDYLQKLLNNTLNNKNIINNLPNASTLLLQLIKNIDK